jgi:hypothetical protein
MILFVLMLANEEEKDTNCILLFQRGRGRKVP